MKQQEKFFLRNFLNDSWSNIYIMANTLNSTIKKLRLSDWVNKQDPSVVYFQERYHQQKEMKKE